MLEVRGLNKTYFTKGAPPVRALNNVSVKLESTGMVFVLGKSGSGKSTFLNVVGGLDKYDSGEIIIKGKSSSEFRGSDFDSYRNTYLGFIFQEYNLINEFTLGRNIALAMELQNRKAGAGDVEEILKKVELDGLADRMPLQISGGQRQRVAIARALIKDPEIIMADEPTGALDSATGASIFTTLQNLSKKRLVLIVSHDRDFAEIYGDRIIEFKDGQIVSDMIKKDEGFEETVDNREVVQVEEIIEVSKKANLGKEHIAILTKLLDDKKQEQASTGRRKKKGSFVNTTEDMLDLKKGNANPFSLIKSRLPQKNALKMARSSMKHKRVRLFFSIFLSVIAVTLFGFSNVVGNFNERELAKSLIRDYGYKHMILSKEAVEASSMFDGQSVSVGFSDEEKAEIADITDSTIATYYQMGDSIATAYGELNSDDNEDYYYGAVHGVVATNDFAALGLNVPPAYGRYPEKSGEILITNFMAENLQKRGMRYYENGVEKLLLPTKNTKINDILTYTAQMYSMGQVKIVGIVNFPIERYAELKLNSTAKKASKALTGEFEQRKLAEISYIYTLPETAAGLSNNGNAHYNCFMDFGLPKGEVVNQDNVYMSSSYPLAYEDFSIYNTFEYLGKDGSTVPNSPQKGQLVLNISEYLRFEDMRRGLYNYANNNKYNLTTIELSQKAAQLGIFDKTIKATAFQQFLYQYCDLEYEYFSGEFEVVGVIANNSDYYSNGNIGLFHQEDYAQICKHAETEQLFVYLKDYATASSFINNFVGEFGSEFKGINRSFTFGMPFSENIYDMSMLFKTFSLVFFWISIVMCVFAALLLLNFISASVTHKKKEIGILRAIGARKVDVMSIFLWEGIIIGLIVFAISLLFVFATIVVFNNVIGSLVGIPLTMLVVGFLPILFMALVCFGTIAVAIILPTRRVASLKPMDAIRSM